MSCERVSESNSMGCGVSGVRSSLGGSSSSSTMLSKGPMFRVRVGIAKAVPLDHPQAHVISTRKQHNDTTHYRHPYTLIDTDSEIQIPHTQTDIQTYGQRYAAWGWHVNDVYEILVS